MAKSPEVEHLEKAVAAGAKLIKREGVPLTEVVQEGEEAPATRPEGA